MQLAVLPRSIRALIVDDDEGMRTLASLVIQCAENGVVVAAQASSPDEAVAQWRATRPDVIVLDYRMPGRDGLAVAAEILAESPSQAVILFSASLDEVPLGRAEHVGVRACLAKDAVDDLPELIRACVE
jgi:DNA-binding NarL/FixJ family response regulator